MSDFLEDNDFTDIKFYINGVLQTFVTAGGSVTQLRLYSTEDPSTNNLLRIYPSQSYLSDLKIYLKPTLEETQIDDIAVQLENPFAEYLLYDNQDTSGNQAHLSGTITEQGRDLDGRQWMRRGSLSRRLRELPRQIITPNGTGFTMSFDIKYISTTPNTSSVVFSVGSLIDGGYPGSSTNPIGTGINYRQTTN